MGSVSEQWGSYSFLYGPIVAGTILLALIVLLRWAFPTRRRSMVKATSPAAEPDYGLLRCVTTTPTIIEAEMMRLTLKDQGVHAGLATTTIGTDILVFPADLKRAEWILGKSGRTAPPTQP